MIRDEIENIIKEYKIDRTGFYEYSKFGYKDIIKKFSDSFGDKSKTRETDLDYIWLNLKESLQKAGAVDNYKISWSEFLQKVKDIVPKTNDDKFYVILSEGWVYEGRLDEIIAVLNETTALLQDFYIVSRKFGWFVCYSSDADAAMLYYKPSGTINTKKCAELLADNIPGADRIYEEHINAYGEILLHVLAGDVIDKPLTELLKDNTQKELIGVYCDIVEKMWRYGDEDVKNVADVTVLEYISARNEQWRTFGTYISDDFKKYINETYVPANENCFKIEKLR